MNEKSLFERCKADTNIESDTFVGIQCVDGNYEIFFPLGYHLAEDERILRKDILLLLHILSKFNDKKESDEYGKNKGKENSFPIMEYLYIIKDYFERGYYKETETQFKLSKRGKINWNRTIKTQKPVIQDDEVYYLNYIVRKNNINENELITLIHKYCVYISFQKLGWLFTSFMPYKPKIPQNRKAWVSIVFDKLQNTFQDRNRELFKSMLAVLNEDGNEVEQDFQYGTDHFEHVWERMLDFIFGIRNKNNYFPKTAWHLCDGTEYENNNLMPDTIMISGEKIYVLDAKYYKYGWSGIPAHLPETASIHKQITYGEYIAETDKFIKPDGTHPDVFNVFIMPYDSKGKRFPTHRDVHFIGSAASDWKKGQKEYESVLGFLMDVKYLMSLSANDRQEETKKLVAEIEQSYEYWKNTIRKV